MGKRMKKYNLDAIFHDAIEYELDMTDKQFVLLERRQIEFDIEEMQERLVALRKYYGHPRSGQQKRKLEKLQNQITNLKASLLHKAWN